MSLVHEALQKAEREKQRKSGAAAPSATTAPASVRPASQPMPQPVDSRVAASPSTTQSRRSSRMLLVVVASCAVVIATVAIVYMASRGSAASKEGGGTTNSIPIAILPAEVQPPHPVNAVEPHPTVADDLQFKITGIMKDPEGKYCAVLNGRVIYETQYVDGATVKRIERDRVTLEVGGREVVARLF